ncbi:MAG: hypothetical protein MJZ78_06500 [Bacteroidales bacterium]|nr:hypothetical protein [Bacteroidales bacterium]
MYIDKCEQPAKYIIFPKKNVLHVQVKCPKSTALASGLQSAAKLILNM